MRESKEEKLISHGEKLVIKYKEEFPSSDISFEYEKLLKEYKKLNKRYEKTIKLGDAMGNEIMSNLDKTVKTARTKIMDNISENRKIKESSLIFQNKIKELENCVEDLTFKLKNSENKLQLVLSRTSQKNTKIAISPDKDELLSLNLNIPQLSKISVGDIVKYNLKMNKEKLILARLSLNNFEQISGVASSVNFLTSIFKYLKNSFHKDEIVYHYKLQEFYIVSKVKSLDDFILAIKALSSKRTILNTTISFSSGITAYKDNDDEKILLDRCDGAFEEANGFLNKTVVK